MKWLFLFCFIFLGLSCNFNKKQFFTADINFNCTPVEYFDTLETVLLTNDKSDLGGKRNELVNLFSGARVYKKNLVKKNGHFYLDSIENAEYWLLLIECKLHNNLYNGVRKNLDFSNNKNDTLSIDICIQPNVQIIQ